MKSGKPNNRLLCEMVTHENFRRFLVDAEIYIDHIAAEDMSVILKDIREKHKAEMTILSNYATRNATRNRKKHVLTCLLECRLRDLNPHVVTYNRF